MDTQIIAMNRQMTVNVDTINKLMAASTGTADTINKLMAASTGTAAALEAYETRLVMVESTVKNVLAESATMKDALCDVRGRQLTLLREEVTTTMAGLSHLETQCYAVLNEVNLQIDALMARLEDRCASMAQPSTKPMSDPAPVDNTPHPNASNITAAPSPVTLHVSEGTGLRGSQGVMNRPLASDAEGTQCSRDGHRMHGLADPDWRASWFPADPLPRPTASHPRGTPWQSDTPPWYYGSRDTQNEAARVDPNRYVPPHTRPTIIDTSDTNNGEAPSQGGQIISPRHWDRRQQAQLAGHSPLDAAALACKEYHGYDDRYYPLTADIIRRCGYRDAHGGVSPSCNDIIYLHQRVMDAWVN